MGRRATGWWNAAKDGWYVELDGEQVRLAGGKGAKAEAQKELRRLLAERDRAGKAGRGMTCSQVFGAFYLHTEGGVARGEKRPVTLEGYGRYLDSAESSFGAVPAADVRPRHVHAWLDARGWGATGRFNAITAVKAAFRWAKRFGHLADNPLADMDRPRPARRESAMGEGRVRQILAGPGAARKKGERTRPDEAFGRFLFALAETGCRPGELAGLTAAMFDLDAGRWVVPNKVGHATGERTRAVILTGAMVELSRVLAAERPEGPVFRNARGRPWTRHALSCRFARLRKKGLAAPGECAYAVRHGRATDLLAAGVPIATVAELLGHKDVTMVARVYSKLAGRADHLREAVEKGRPSGDPPRDPPGSG